jgi:hypothetical protein
VGDWGRVGPGEVGERRAGLVLLSCADEEGETAGGSQQGGGDGKDGLEAFDGAEGDYVEGFGERFGTGVLYIDVRQCKGAGDFAEEGGFLVVGFDQGEGDVWGPEFEGEAGESCAGAEVGDAGGKFNIFNHRGHRGRHRVEEAGGEERFAEVAGDDVFGVADGGQVDAGVPVG